MFWRNKPGITVEFVRFTSYSQAETNYQVSEGLEARSIAFLKDCSSGWAIALKLKKGLCSSAQTVLFAADKYATENGEELTLSVANTALRSQRAETGGWPDKRMALQTLDIKFQKTTQVVNYKISMLTHRPSQPCTIIDQKIMQQERLYNEDVWFERAGGPSFPISTAGFTSDNSLSHPPAKSRRQHHQYLLPGIVVSFLKWLTST